MPLNDDQLRAIGRITVLSAQLEYAANVLAWGLLITPHLSPHREIVDQEEFRQIGPRAFAGENFASIITKIQRLSEYVLRRSPQTLTEVQAWTAKARDLQERRNEIVHALWSDPHITGEVIPFRLLGKGKPKAARTRLSDLDQLANDIEAAIKEITPTLQAIVWPRYPP